MARATTKTELFDATTTQWSRLQALIDSMRPDIETAKLFFGADFNRPEAHWARDENLRDILAHLFAWQAMLLDFVDANRSGISRRFLPGSHTWRTTPALNAEILQRYQHTPLQEVEDMLASTHTQILELIETFSDEELFTKKHFAWTGSTSLGSYFVSAAPSHYDWAIKKLRAHKKATAARP